VGVGQVAFSASQVAVILGVMVGNGVNVFVVPGVAVGIISWAIDSVSVSVGVGVRVSVGMAVGTAVRVGVALGVPVGLAVAVGVSIAVLDGV
jgi:hypothetical protein